jgi:hypothetical protein
MHDVYRKGERKLIKNNEENRLLERPACSFKDNIKADVKRKGYKNIDYIQLLLGIMHRVIL